MLHFSTNRCSVIKIGNKILSNLPTKKKIHILQNYQLHEDKQRYRLSTKTDDVLERSHIDPELSEYTTYITIIFTNN